MTVTPAFGGNSPGAAALKPLFTISILADSLALPRPLASGNIPYAATYPALLDLRMRCLFPQFNSLLVEKGQWRRTIVDVANQWDELVTAHQASVVIVHVGIVDCAPRVFLPRQNALIASLGPGRLQRWILGFVEKHRRRIIQMRPNRVYVKKQVFDAKLMEVEKLARESPIRGMLLINIISPPDDLEHRSPGYRANVEQYNKSLASRADGQKIRLIDLNSIIWDNGGPQRLTVDGIHINAEGHQLLADQIVTHLCEWSPAAAGEIDAPTPSSEGTRQ